MERRVGTLWVGTRLGGREEPATLSLRIMCVCVHIERQVLRVAHQASVRQVREAGVWTLSRK